ncbi:MAG: hypothetical protein M1354_01770 [Candidatus Marsarchaeota archaeon]|jgi:DNA-binding Lrp family transcriptional regulator|nr:hypothetical protein [Candidatus Marsarchaeota archaeon]
MRAEARIEERILTALSMNGRAPARLVGKIAGISSQKAYRKICNLEDKYRIRYLAEVNLESLGYLKFIMLIKFLREIPQADDLRKVLEPELRIQYATVLRGGDYDLMLYIMAESNIEIGLISTRLRRNTLLLKYPAEWYTTPFYEHYGFMPLRDEFIDTLKDKIVSRGRSRPYQATKEKKKQIMQREFAILRELNSNGSADLMDVDRKYGFDTGRAQYAYYKLVESGILKRISISLQALPIRYIAAIFIKITDMELYYGTRDSLLMDIVDRSDTPVNKYALAGDIATPFGVMLLMPVFGEHDLDDTIRMLSEAKGMTIKSAIITTTLVGGLCFRRFDNAYSEQAEFLHSEFGVRLPKKIDYEEKSHSHIKSSGSTIIDFEDLV